MLKQVTPYLVQIAGQILQDAAREGIRAKFIRKDTVVTVSAGPPTPEIEGCPYCQMAKLLAGAHLYVTRAQEKPPIASLYQSLARIQINECLWVIEHIPPKVSHSRMEGRLREIQNNLRPPLAAPQLAEVGKDIWAAAYTACDLAEWVNGQQPRAIPQGPVVDGEARVID